MEHHFSYQKSYRYETLNDVQSPKNIIIVLHGYGQLAKYFIRKFSSLSIEDTLIVAPEGMHRFYLKGSSGRVGASWMTKEDRQSDIEDNIAWLDALYAELKQQYAFENSIILGFSQGGATAARWYKHSKYKHHSLLIWASVFPPDMKSEKELPSTKEENNFFFLGTNDIYFNKEQQVEVIDEFKEKKFEIVTYSGGHDIDIDVLKPIIAKIIS